MLKLEKLFIENIKSIKSAEVNFKDLTVVTGVNSSGKSTLIQSILYLAQWFGSSEFISNEDEFYVPYLSIYDRYLVNKNRSYEGLKQDLENPIKLGFKNQNQELNITFSNSSHSGLRVNPENISLKNTGMNNTKIMNRYPELADLTEPIPIKTGPNLDLFIEQYFLGNLYFDLIGPSIFKDMKMVDKDLEPFSTSSLFNFDHDEIAEKRNKDNDKFIKFLKTKRQFDFSQSTNLTNGILKQTDRNFGDSYIVTNSKLLNLFSKRYRQEINSGSLVLKESNFFLQFFISKLPKDIVENTNFGSGIRENEDFLDFSDDLIKDWINSSKRIILKNLINESNLPKPYEVLKAASVQSNEASAENIFFVFQMFIDNIVKKNTKNALIEPLKIPEYIDSYIKDLSIDRKERVDNVTWRRIFDAIDQLEYLAAEVNKQVKDFGTDLVLTAEEIFVSPTTIPLWNRSKSSDLEQLKDDIRNGDKPFISVKYEPDINRYSLIDGYPEFLAYQELGIGAIHVKLISSENNYCLCNNRSWKLNDTDIDRFIDQSNIKNTKTYICPKDEEKVHLGYFARGEDTESADAQRFNTFFLYPQKTKPNSYDEPLDFLYDLFTFLEKHENPKNFVKKYFNFIFEDQSDEFLADEIEILKNYIEKDPDNFPQTNLTENLKLNMEVPDYGFDHKKSRKRPKIQDYYNVKDSQKSIFDFETIDDAKIIIKYLKKLQKSRNSKKPLKSKLSLNSFINKFFDVKVLLYEKTTMHGTLENVYPNPFSEKDGFLNNLSYLSTIRDPDNQNDPVGNYAKLLPIGQNAGGLAEYLTLHGDREVEPFLSPKFKKTGELIRDFDEFAWIQNKSMTLYDAIRLWLEYLGLKDFDFQVINEGTQSRIKFLGGPTSSRYGREITEIGSGIGKILPVIVNCLIAKKGDVVLIEEPETHLHPSAQSYLADFLFAMSSSRQIIIETHSPNIIDRLRFRNIHKSVNYLDEDMRPEVEIIFAELEDSFTAFRQGKINNLGDIEFENTDDSRPWPAGFFDNTDRDLNNILRARKEILMKKRNS